MRIFLPLKSTLPTRDRICVLLLITVDCTNERRIIVLGQDAHRAKDRRRLCSNKGRIILFVVLGQDAHRAIINEDFKTSLQSCAKQRINRVLFR
ncbi:hypothetical protein V1478_001411 [Vespula squamosa]|uniref:Secreted protein n=1 Tax=Vespula squamosa TaxID=30214 RepID=A0ABD2C1E3_VESSQ